MGPIGLGFVVSGNDGVKMALQPATLLSESTVVIASDFPTPEWTNVVLVA